MPVGIGTISRGAHDGFRSSQHIECIIVPHEGGHPEISEIAQLLFLFHPSLADLSAHREPWEKKPDIATPL